MKNITFFYTWIGNKIPKQTAEIKTMQATAEKAWRA